MGAEDGRHDPDVRARIDARVAGLADATLAAGWDFRIVDESPAHVAFEARPSQGGMWRKVVVSVDDHGDVRVKTPRLPETQAESRIVPEARRTARQALSAARVPDGGLPVQSVPNRNAHPTGRIEGGLVVHLIERSGIWVRIEADESDPVWVESAALEPT